MKRRLLDLIVCPTCAGELDCEATDATNQDIVTGRLICRSCGATFPVRRGIPRLVPGALAEDKRRTADAFGWEWQEFRELHGKRLYREQFLDWISPIRPSFFANKVVLDAGCGMGRFAIMSAEFGARDVLAIDLSDAVEAAAENARDYPNVHVIQGDVYSLPLPRRGSTERSRPRKGSSTGRAVVDFAYSIGVLHHLPDPGRGFQEVSERVKADGALFAWVYGRENNGWIVRVVNPLRESISSRLPRRALYALSFEIAAALQIPLKLLYRPSSVVPSLRPIQRVLPYRAYFNWLAGYGLRHNHHVVFDHLVAPTAFYLQRDEFETWFARAGFRDVTISWRNQNSWRGLGQTLAVGQSVATP